MKTSVKVSIAVLLGGLAIAAVATGTGTIRDQWLGEYPNACATLKTAAADCSLCHTSVPSLNPYGQDRKDFGSFDAIEDRDSDGDGVINIVEINHCTLPGDPTSVTPVDPATWSSIKALFD